MENLQTSLGTTTSSKVNALVSDALWPILTSCSVGKQSQFEIREAIKRRHHGSGYKPQADLATFAETRRIGIHNESSEGLTSRAFRVRAGSGQHEIPVGHPSVGDPHFLSIQHVFVPFLLSPGAKPSNIRSSTWLSHSISLPTDRSWLKTGHCPMSRPQTAYLHTWEAPQTCGPSISSSARDSQQRSLAFAARYNYNATESSGCPTDQTDPKRVSLNGCLDASATVRKLFCDDAGVHDAQTRSTYGGDHQKP